MATFVPRFNLYGPTPSAAAAQQMPWTGFYAQHNQNEVARAEAANLQSLRFAELERQRAEEAERLRYAARLGQARHAETLARQAAQDAEQRRQFNLGLVSQTARLREDRRQFDVGAGLRQAEIDARREAYEPAPTAAETLEQQIDFLRAETARAQARQEADEQAFTRQQTGKSLTPEQRQATRKIDQDRAMMILRSLGDRIGRVPATVRWDDDLQDWTTEPRKVATGTDFRPSIGGLREAEAGQELPPAPAGFGSRMITAMGETTMQPYSSISKILRRFGAEQAAPPRTLRSGATGTGTGVGPGVKRDWVNEPPRSQKEYDSIQPGERYMDVDERGNRLIKIKG